MQGNEVFGKRFDIVEHCVYDLTFRIAVVDTSREIQELYLARTKGGKGGK
jgi:hypothetical protein